MYKKNLIIAISIAIIIAGLYKILPIKKSSLAYLFQQSGQKAIVAKFDTAKNQIIKIQDKTVYENMRWVDSTTSGVLKDSLKYLSIKQPLFTNLQIWPGGLFSNKEGSVASIVLSGFYDEKLIAFFKLLSKSSHQQYVSYNAAMEAPSYQLPWYPWQAQSSKEYILSFRHIFTISKKFAPSVQIVWSPAGVPGAEEYWPGNDFVDLISINIDLDKAPNQGPYPPYGSVAELMRRKLFRMRFMNKPILFLAEKAAQKEIIQQKWLDEINTEILADIAIFRTSIIPAEHVTSLNNKPREKKLELGVYDPSLQLAGQPSITTEHIFTDLISVTNGVFKKDFDAATSRKHNVIVTMEPWKDGIKEKDPEILSNTLNGHYDKVWTKLYEIISAVPQTVYLRWGHEMEIPIERYAWQSKDPVAYIKAFRYFATFKQPRPSNIKIVWGPAGDRGSVEYYPGDDVVDFVSVAIYGLPDKDINDYNRQQSFATIFQYKFYRMRFTHRPVFITEFGVKGPEAYKKKWLVEAAATINKYPEIFGCSYFNFKDTPKAWGNAETPDWSITDTTFKTFISFIN